MRSRRSFSDRLKKKARRGFRGHPVATIAFYGPDDTTATKIAVGIVNETDDVIALERWHSEARDVRFDQDIARRVLEFIKRQNARSVVMTDGIIGCPHEEGVDYPAGESCPQCPFWAGRDRWTGELIH